MPLPPWAMRAGARETIYFNPAEVNVAIVTCGGLCPGLNDVIQGLVNKLTDYGVPEGHILGVRHADSSHCMRCDVPVPLPAQQPCSGNSSSTICACPFLVEVPAQHGLLHAYAGGATGASTTGRTSRWS